MRLIKLILFVTVYFLIGLTQVHAIHLRAANIFVDRVEGSNTRFLVTLEVFSDDGTDAYNGTQGGVQIENEQEIYLNDNPTPFLIDKVGAHQQVGNETNKTVFQGFVDVPSPNGRYVFKWRGILRNEGILNIRSVTDTPYSLYVETYILLNGGSLVNSSPETTIDPVDKGYTNSVYQYNSGAFDVDGDSLSYELIPIRSGTTNNNGALVGVNIPNQVSPADSEIGGGGSLTIDPIRGTVTWESPQVAGEYNIAIRINEWRNGIRVGYVVRDMQIIIEENDLDPPLIDIPNDTCVVAGTRLDVEIFAYDINGDQVSLELLGEVLQLGGSLQTFPVSPDTVRGDFVWTPTCTTPREQPYFAIFKATSNPTFSFRLSSYEEWAIEVVGEPVSNVQSSYVSERVRVTWDPYCSGSNGISSLEIWRRSCDTIPVFRDYCEVGVPDSWGFQKVGEVGADEVSFDDLTALRGGKYYYVVVANISALSNSENKGQSIASNIAEVETLLDDIWIPSVSIVQHDSTTGQIEVSYRFSSTLTETPPFQLEILRADSLGGDFASIDTIDVNSVDPSSYLDSGLDTYLGRYIYRIDVWQSGAVLVSSQEVSVLDLDANANERDITLTWEGQALLFTPDTLYTNIHRDYNVYPEYDSVVGERYTYSDLELPAGEEFCYYVIKPVAFCNNEIDTTVDVVSTASCTRTFDFTPPCPPILSLEPLVCEFYDPSQPTQNTLTWEWDVLTCQEEAIEFYELVFSANSNSEFVTVYQGTDLSYIHQLSETFVGCYKIRAQDVSGNLGDFSNVVCNDNCPFIEFPNTFTPNLDGKNDVFRPTPTPQFVESIDVKIINRWGKQVYRGTSFDLNLWDGVDSEGTKVSSGVYYYEANVKFKRYDQNNNIESYKGWLLVLY